MYDAIYFRFCLIMISKFLFTLLFRSADWRNFHRVVVDELGRIPDSRKETVNSLFPTVVIVQSRHARRCQDRVRKAHVRSGQNGVPLDGLGTTFKLNALLATIFVIIPILVRSVIGESVLEKHDTTIRQGQALGHDRHAGRADNGDLCHVRRDARILLLNIILLGEW